MILREQWKQRTLLQSKKLITCGKYLRKTSECHTSRLRKFLAKMRGQFVRFWKIMRQNFLVFGRHRVWPKTRRLIVWNNAGRRWSFLIRGNLDKWTTSWKVTRYGCITLMYWPGFKTKFDLLRCWYTCIFQKITMSKKVVLFKLKLRPNS